MRALSAVEGSWNTTETTRPICRLSFAVRWVTSEPLKYTCPEVGRCSPHITLAVVDFPQPDSPTMPIVSPAFTVMLTPRTAWMCVGLRMEPVRVLKETVTSLS